MGKWTKKVLSKQQEIVKSNKKMSCWFRPKTLRRGELITFGMGVETNKKIPVGYRKMGLGESASPGSYPKLSLSVVALMPIQAKRIAKSSVLRWRWLVAKKLTMIELSLG